MISNCYVLLDSISKKVIKGILVESAFAFVTFIEIFLIMYILMKCIMKKSEYTNKVANLLAPILQPIRFLIKHSIFRTATLDYSPLIVLIITIFIQNFLYKFM